MAEALVPPGGGSQPDVTEAPMMAGTMLAFAVTLPLRADAPPGDTTSRDVKRGVAALNRAFEKGDVSAAGRLMTEDHVAITPYYGGPQGRAEQLRSLTDLKLDEYAAGEMKVTPLGKDAALVT